MPTISGLIRHAGTRFGSIGSLTAIPNVDLCLYNPSTSTGIYALTSSTGAFTFNSVPAGTYILVECGQDTIATLSTVDFTTATSIPAPTPSDPPYSKIVTPIANTNTVDSLSPNTLNLTVTTTNLANQNFTDSTVQNTPLSIPNGVILGPSLLVLAGNGIWGTLPNGTPVETVPTTYPYTNSMTTGLTYRPGGISLTADDFYMINIQNSQWYLLSNHTTFDETSSMLAVNGGNPSVILFKETVTVEPNTFYLAGAWLNMITNAANSCLIGFRALASDGVTQLFYGQTSNIQYGKWGEIGQIFNTKNNSTITLQVLTMSTVSSGNDFVLDDVTLQKVTLNSNVTLAKSVNLTNAKVGDTLVYTSVINTTSDIINLYFQDTIPNGTTFNSGTVKVNGTPQIAYNPQTGFTLPNMTANGVATVTFDVTVVSIPASSTIDNLSNLTYSLTIIPGNTITNTIQSNTVITNLIYVSIDSLKTVDKLYAKPGDILTYTIRFTNNGNTDSLNTILIDSIPLGTTFINSSVNVDGITIPTASPNPPTGISLNTIVAGGTTTVSFMVLVN